ncbi:hypothetical protein [Wolbachia endosymbiont of Zygogramma bicolorata]
MQNGKLDGYRKNSFFTWSERGERFVERMLSIFLTSRLNGQNPVTVHGL